MQRHIIDRPKLRDDSIRLRAFLTLARAEGRHPAAVALHRRAEGREGAQKLRHYLRIARGRLA
ncbi:MAG: hypothetical protein GW886_08850 [Rhodobacterales bacterium]|nr:hypothetical protein [Rhodobacterales bacterium]NCT12949.1 hypothetical protein [Rhodobacterales bacterium]